MELLITSNIWVEALVKKEIESNWYKITCVKDRLISFQWDEKAIATMNLWSRFWNKIYIQLARSKVNSFEDLFQLVQGIDWFNLITPGQPIVVDAVSIKSILSSIPAIQSIAKKSIVKKLLMWKEEQWPEDQDEYGIEILVVIDMDDCYILLNTTWNSLHQRGYRVLNVDAPLKENLAAAIVAVSNRKYSKPFYDFFCWWGTIPIEAAMIAKNMAPWMNRKFDFEEFKWFDKQILKDVKKEALEKQYLDKEHIIVWYDISAKNIDIARLNAKKAWVDKFIRFETCAFEDQNLKDIRDCFVVSNPPYGIRLDTPELNSIYLKIRNLFENWDNIWWGIITAAEDFRPMINRGARKDRKLYNWWQKCYFYRYLW